MLKNNRGQTGLWEGLIILILIGALVGTGFIIWNLLKNQNAIQNIYQKDSNPMVSQSEPNIHPVCGIIMSWSNNPPKEKNAVSTNSQNKH